MTLLVPTVGKNAALELIVNKASGQNLVLRLFKSNTTPAEGDTAVTYTEADFTGYTAITLTGASWSATNGSVSYAQQTFTSSAAQSVQSIYGYYLTQAASGVLMWTERFSDGPYSISNNADQIKVTPVLTLE